MASVNNWEEHRPNPAFFGRQREMQWLFDRFRGRGTPIVISGPGGVGKTTLLRQFLASVRTTRPPLLFTPDLYRPGEAMAQISAKIEELDSERNPPEIVAIDDAGILDDRQLNVITSRVLNRKAVRALIFVTRRPPELTRAEVLELGAMSLTDAQSMLRSLLDRDFPSEEIIRAAEAAECFPLALQLLAGLIRERNPAEIERILRGEIYNLPQQLILPENKLITDVGPRIILANETIIERLKRQPSSIYDLPPRKFEELIADLLKDLGYEVELTPATRDGGKDILAYMNTPHGKLLCLVEAKRYRQDRSVGVELVRALYGTLIDADASSVMLVTTSSFSPDAQAFQQRHRYKLALRDYGDVVQWIEHYKGRCN